MLTILSELFYFIDDYNDFINCHLKFQILVISYIYYKKSEVKMDKEKF